MFKRPEKPNQTFTVLIKLNNEESGVIMDWRSESQLACPPNYPVASFSMPTAIAVYGMLISFSLQSGEWHYGELDNVLLLYTQFL